MALTEDMADEIAQLALADEKRSGDETIIAQVAEILGASSQTLQEAFLTSDRVRRAERRARATVGLCEHRAPLSTASGLGSRELGLRTMPVQAVFVDEQTMASHELLATRAKG